MKNYNNTCLGQFRRVFDISTPEIKIWRYMVIIGDFDYFDKADSGNSVLVPKENQNKSKFSVKIGRGVKSE